MPQLSFQRIALWRFGLLALGLLLTWLPVQIGAQGAGDRSPQGRSAPLAAGPEDLQFTPDGLRFRLITPGYVFNQGHIEAPGLNGATRQPGAPVLPFYAALIAVPPEARLAVTVREMQPQVQPVGSLATSPYPVAAISESESLDLHLDSADHLARYAPDPAIFDAAAPYPAARFAISEPLYYRDVRLYAVSVYPFAYQAAEQALIHFPALDVEVRFVDASDPGTWKPAGAGPAVYDGLNRVLLNGAQATAWRSLPRDFQATPTNFPLGIPTYKLEVNQDGIYRVTYAELAAAGMPVASVDDRQFVMMHRGQSVAYRFDGVQDGNFTAGEAILFYGQKFRGSRFETRYVNNNVYWLWVDTLASPQLVPDVSGATGHPPATSFPESITREDELVYSFTHSDKWDTFPNEADNFWWDSLSQTGVTTSYTRTIQLFHPAPAGPNATVTTEFLSRVGGLSQDHVVRVTMNGDPNEATSPAGWRGIQDVNVVASIPLTNVRHGSNDVRMTLATVGGANVDRHLLNRVTVDYQRQFIAVNDNLIFSHPGQSTFAISGFGANQPRVWDITDPLQPQQLNNVVVTGSGPYAFEFGADLSGTVRFIATTTSSTSSVLAITPYTAGANSLEPAVAEVDWLVISHGNFITQANRLATHRQNPLYGGLRTFVVNVQDVYNQYGYGLAMPQAITDYLAHTLADWTVAPQHVILFGDGNTNPRGLDEQSGFTPWWDKNEPNYVITNLLYKDRFVGFLPSDFPFVLLSGGDLVAEMNIGRFSVQTVAAATNVVDKVIVYDTNGRNQALYNRLRNVVFVSDNDDAGGQFCNESMTAANDVPDAFQKVHLCLDDPANTSALRTQLSNWINVQGTSILNYRGHGSWTAWASPAILNSSMTSFWVNANLPVAIISMDCLDGVFALNGVPGMGEVFFGLGNNAGSVAHWSSTGLGYTFEHQILHREFYEGLFAQGMTAIGDAIAYAKLQYFLTPIGSGSGQSELYSFTLQGDPAMQLYYPEPSLTKTTNASQVRVGDEVDYQLSVSNDGLYPGHVTITDLLPAGQAYVSHSASVTSSLESAAPHPVIKLDFGQNNRNTGMPYGQSATVTITVEITAPGSLTNTATINMPGLDINPGNNADSATVTATLGIFMPAINRP